MRKSFFWSLVMLVVGGLLGVCLGGRPTVYSVNRQGLWWLALGDEPARKLVNKVMKEAQVAVESAAQDPGLVEQARRRAERVIRRAFEVVGWEVALTWTR
jgi:hypothetical protein